MAHSHHHTHHTGNIKVAFFLNLLFTLIEFAGGIYTNSIAITSDAIHDLGDTFSLGLSWFFQRKSNKDRDNQYSFGYGRFSLLGALLNAIILFLGSIFIFYKAIPRLFAPEAPHSNGMIIMAIFGVIINGLAVYRLSKGSSMNERVVKLHLLEDVLGWIAVLIGAVIIKFTNYYIIDPILSIFIGLYILKNIYKNLKETIKIILQAIPKDLDITAIEKDLKSIPGLIDCHDAHLWTMDGEFHIMSLHAVCEDASQYKNIIALKLLIREKLQSYGIEHATIEIEFESELCAASGS